ncbi:hypothetical protein BG004_000322 [Podila humilis]|nr:hypothetical protein BG004_000322 [Podila humilis]
MTRWLHRIFSLLDALLYLLVLSVLHITGEAQSSFVPQTTEGSMSVFIEGKALYVQSGVSITTGAITNQTFYIDLSVPWPVTNPVFKPLPDGLNVFRRPSALLQDGETWVSITDTAVRTYNIKTGSLVRKQDMGLEGTDRFLETEAFGNPENDEVIVVRRSGGVNGVRATLFSEANGLTVTAIAPPADYINYTLYSMAWSDSHKAAFAFGGESDLDSYANVLWRWDIKTNSWSKFIANGDVPSRRDTSCMVAAQGGDKLVVFGGRVSGSFGSDVYVYEIANNSWKKGKDGGISRAKMDHVCAMSGTKLVVWGGRGTSSGVTAVYDIATDAWLDQYTPPPPPPPAPTKVSPESETPSTRPDEEPESNAAAIAGGVCGAIAVVAIISGFLIYRRRRKNTRPSQHDHHAVDTEPAFELARGSLEVAHTNKLDPPEDSASKPGLPKAHPGDHFAVASNEGGRPRNPQTETEQQQKQTRVGSPQTINATKPRDPQYSHNTARDTQVLIPPMDGDRLQEMQLEEREALDELIESHRQEQLQIQRQIQHQKEAQLAKDRKLQLLIEQRRAYEESLGSGA